jgi:hypothetical protein
MSELIWSNMVASNPKRASDPHALPDVEYWHAQSGDFCVGDAEPNQTGWYWQACFPGCLPDSEPVGPFATKAECVADFTRDDGSTRCAWCGNHNGARCRLLLQEQLMTTILKLLALAPAIMGCMLLWHSYCTRKGV